MTDRFILQRYAINVTDLDIILSDDGDWVYYNDHLDAMFHAVKKIEAEKREAVMQSLASLGQADEAYMAQLNAEIQRDSAVNESILLRSILRSAIDSISSEVYPEWVIRAQVALKEAEK